MTIYKIPSRLLLLTTVFSIELSLSALADSAPTGPTASVDYQVTRDFNGNYTEGLIEDGDFLSSTINYGGILNANNDVTVFDGVFGDTIFNIGGEIHLNQGGRLIYPFPSGGTVNYTGIITCKGSCFASPGADLVNFNGTYTSEYQGLAGALGQTNILSNAYIDTNYQNSSPNNVLSSGGVAVMFEGGVDVAAGAQIITRGANSIGLFQDDRYIHSGNLVKNSGLIETHGSSSHGIYIEGDNTQVVNDGNIDIYGASAHGIRNEGASTEIINNSNIRSNSVGIFNSALGAEITNNGTIYFLSNLSDGNSIYNTGNDVKITNNASLNNISNTGDNTEIINESSGRFSTNINSASYFISNSGNNTKITNKGTMELDYSPHRTGISSSGNNVTILNSGRIYTKTDQTAIRSTYTDNSNINSNNVIENTGYIDVGEGSFGIASYSGKGTIIKNSGTIESVLINDGDAVSKLIDLGALDGHIINEETGLLKSRNYTISSPFANDVAAIDTFSNVTNIGRIEIDGEKNVGIRVNYTNGFSGSRVVEEHVINNSGLFKINGANNIGILNPMVLRAGTGKFYNSGDFNILGDNNLGYYANSQRVEIENSGNINVYGQHDENVNSKIAAIVLENSFGSVKNSNNFILTGNSSKGIYLDNTDEYLEVVNTGVISVNGNKSIGIVCNNCTSKIKNLGEINVGGENALGLFYNGLFFYSNDPMTGKINVTGQNAAGIQANAMFNPYDINVSGQNATALFGVTDNPSFTSAITNLGTLKISNETAKAYYTADKGYFSSSGHIEGLNKDHTVVHIKGQGYFELLEGANIIGNILLEGDNSTVVLYDEKLNNATISFSSDADGNALVFNATGIFNEGGGVASKYTDTPDFDNVTGNYIKYPRFTNYIFPTTQGRVVRGTDGNVYAVTPDSVAGAQSGVTTAAIQSGNVVTQRQQLALLGKTTGISEGTMVASDASSMNDIDPAAGWGMQERKVFWVEGFGSYRERPQDKDSAFSRAKSAGSLVGVDFPANDDFVRGGLYGGAFTAQQNLGKITFREIESNGYLFGGYLGKSFPSFYGSVQLSVGYSQNESDRYVSGQKAEADYDSFFVSPSLTVMKPLYGEAVDWVPSLTVRYTAQFAEEYTEKGSAVPQNVKANDTHSLSARAQMEGHLADIELGQGTLTPIVRVGLDGQTNIGPNTVNLSVLGTNMSFDPKGGDNYVDGFAGVNLSYKLEDDVELYFDGELQSGLNKSNHNDNIGANLRLGARWQF